MRWIGYRGLDKIYGDGYDIVSWIRYSELDKI